MDETMVKNVVTEEEERTDVLSELEQAAVEEGCDVTRLPENPELTGGIELKSFVGGVGLVLGAVGIYKIVKSDKVQGWIKNHREKKEQRADKKREKEENFDREFDEDAEFREPEDEETEGENPEEE